MNQPTNQQAGQQQVSADMLVTMIGEQAVEIRVLRAQLAQGQAALAEANGHIRKLTEEVNAGKESRPTKDAEDVNAGMESRPTKDAEDVNAGKESRPAGDNGATGGE